jgi:hypothetical protein
MSIQHSLFSNRRVVIATMHGKEKVIGPLLKEDLAVRIVVPKKFNSDQFGTFSGEIERTEDILQTARRKCEHAMELTGCDMAIASEGSFGPHPSLFFVPCDDEFLLFIDKKNKLEFWSRSISTDTNFGGKTIKTIEEALDFTNQIGFPNHRVIIRNTENGVEFIRKGIGNLEDLENYLNYALKSFGTCFIETDMRAMYNPKRMAVIADATQQLLDKIASVCPTCEMPGFSISKSLQGLPCEQCEFPTASVKAHIKTCGCCGHEESVVFPNGKMKEDPMYCNNCNP